MGTTTQPRAESEQVVSMPIRNPEGSGVSRTFRFAGVLDNVHFRPETGAWTIGDWKVVSDIGRFVQQRSIGHQADLYALAFEHMNPLAIVDRIEYRLIEAPTIRLCKKDKSPEDYLKRCIEWLLEPGHLLACELILHPLRKAEAKKWLWDTALRAVENRRTGRWMTNEMACHSWNRQCEYLPLCLLRAEGQDCEPAIATDYERRPDHEELGPETVEDRINPLDIMTYSSASCLALCERKYFWRHERCIRPRREDESDAQRIGSAVHAGMDALVKMGDAIAAQAGIGEWADHHPAIGEEARTKKQQEIARATAICRVAALRWLGVAIEASEMPEAKQVAEVPSPEPAQSEPAATQGEGVNF